jgi:hypothetical protein
MALRGEGSFLVLGDWIGHEQFRKRLRLLSDPVSPVVESLDHISIRIESAKPIYREIGDGWFLYYLHA